LEAIKEYEDHLQQATELHNDEKLRLDNMLVEERERSAAWEERSMLLEGVSQQFTESAQDLCAISGYGKLPFYPSSLSACAND
jgi:hypothetical protein